MTSLESSAEPVQLSARDLQHSASRGAFWTMIHTGVAIPIAFAVNAVVARMLGPADYGTLAVLTLGMALAAQASNLGVNDAVQQWGAAAHARGKRAQVDRLLKSSFGYHMLVQLPILVLAALILGRGQPGYVIVALLVGAALPTLFGTAALSISIENRTAQAARLAMGTNLLVQLTVAGAAVLTHTPVAVWAGRSVAGAMLSPAFLLLLDRPRRRTVMQGRLPRAMPDGFWRFSMITSATGLVAVLVTSRSEVLVMQRTSAPEAIGLFALAFGIAAQMRGPVDALLNPLAPSVAGIVEVHNHLAAATLSRALRVTGLLSGALLVTALPAASLLIPLIYGNRYDAATLLLVPLAVIALSQSFANPLLAFARAQRKSGSLFAITVIALVADLGTAVITVPLWDAWGAVIASSVGQATIITLLARLQIGRGMLTLHRAAEITVPFVVAAIWAILAVLQFYRGPLPIPLGALLATAMAVLGWVAMLRLLPTNALANDVRALAPYLPAPIRPAMRAFLVVLGARSTTKESVMTTKPDSGSSSTEVVEPTLDVLSVTSPEPEQSANLDSTEVSQTEPGEIAIPQARVIAFYLPQFHPTKENDSWWGPGFTEWTNTAKARPLFRGHAQPHLPADLGFYDLRLADTRADQAALAKRYGVEAFCYWHYWFGNGRRVLERPFDEVIASGEPDHKFCLGWANQTWTGIWHGAENRILIEQSYPGKDDERAHFESLLPAFHDRRYLRVDGRPLFYIFRPEQLPDPQGLIERWQGLAQSAGLPGIYFVAEVSDLLGHGPKFKNPRAVGFDAGVYIRLPARADGLARLRMRLRRRLLQQPERYAYAEEVLVSPACRSLFPAVYPNWDNTPRSGRRGIVLDGSSPQRFTGHVRHAVRSLQDRPADERLLFVKSWNEWAEGNYLEPDLEHGHGYLRALAHELGLTSE